MRRFAWCVIWWGFVVPVFAAEPADGVLPVGADGKPLNLDFETGTLKDWTVRGEAFKEQPIQGDTVAPRRGDMKSAHQGRYWIGGYERFGDRPQGTLTSVPFKVTHSWASFLVGGGPHEVTCVELVRSDSGQIIARVSGIEEENLRRVVVDLRPHRSKEIFIRLVDRHSGHWGHVNFDDFRFHAEKPNVPRRPGYQPPPPLDVLKYAGLPPDKAAQAMTVPESFTVKLFAGEPDVHQPIALCLDDRGRVWIAEAYSYPIRRPPLTPTLSPQGGEGRGEGDRIVIFEDTDGDGKFDKRTVFMDGLNLVSGLELGFGGVWIGAAPYLMFVPIKNGEDKPAGPPQILLDGWGWHDTHETLNSFIWGPDGWLYGCHGVFTHSRVGKPGTPDPQRIPINAGIWRYHPTRHVFEVFAQGTSNPWGVDFNDVGEAFCEACVIPHCFHIIPGGRYQRQAGQHFNPFTFADIQTIADHRHYVGGNPHGGNNRSDSAGGGHAHCGAMVYLGGAWPADYRDRLFMGNIHGRRLNVDILHPKGSGYVASHGPDFLLANDAWARFINFRYGPDGNVYLIDWYDKQACHTGDDKIWDRSNGRIYKVCYRGTKTVQLDLARLSDVELARLVSNKNDWYVRHARRILQERYARSAGQPEAANGQSWEPVRSVLKNALKEKEASRRLRALWALHVLGGVPEDVVPGLLTDPSPHVRAWTIRLSAESNDLPAKLQQSIVGMAKTDPSPVVRLAIAAALQRIQADRRWAILENLLQHAEDAADHNLPLMYWYAAEPLAEIDARAALSLAAAARVPMLPFMVRRIAAIGTPPALDLLATELGRCTDSAVQQIYLRGLQEGLRGRRRVPMPEAWPETFAKLLHSRDAEVRQQAVAVAVTFGDQRAFAELRRILASGGELGARQNALATLLAAGDKELAPLLHDLIGDPALRGAALRGLAAYDDPKTPDVVTAVYAKLNPDEKRDALNTLAARVSYGKALMDAMAAKKIPAADVSAELVRQLHNLHDKDLDRRIADVWGLVRATPAERTRLMAEYRKMLTAPARTRPDLSAGRAVYAKTCAQCHVLFGEGGKVGPELTGANRASLDYLLENIVDPSAVIPKEYAATVIELKNGRVVTGIARGETAAAVTVVTANETLTVPKDDIAERNTTPTSMMPDDLLKPLKEEEIRALIAYLQSAAQVPLPPNFGGKP